MPGDPQALILVGNTGSNMWNAFSQMPLNLLNALDHWPKCAIDAVVGNWWNSDLSVRGCALLAASALGGQGRARRTVAAWNSDVSRVRPLARLSGCFGLIPQQLNCDFGTKALSRVRGVKTSPACRSVWSIRSEWTDTMSQGVIRIWKQTRKVTV